MEEKSPSEDDKTDCKVFVDLTSQPLSNTDSMSTGSNRSQQNLVRDYQENGGGTASSGSGRTSDEAAVEAQDKTLSAEPADQPIDEGSAAGEEVIIMWV